MSGESSSSAPKEQNYQLLQGVEVPPFRNVNEFLLETDRYERPPLQDLKKWNNRIISNLIYFQTNYFTTIAALFLVQTFIYSQDIFVGIIATLTVLAAVYFAIAGEPQIKKIRTDHPLITLGGIIVVAYGFISVFPSVLVVVFAILLPIFLVLVHASFRLRGIANRTSNITERFGIRTTLMGQILERAGLSVRV